MIRSDIEAIQQAILRGDIDAAALGMKNLYDRWDSLPEEEQRQMKSLEPIFLSMVQMKIESAH